MAGRAGATERFWRANVFGEVKLGRERFGIRSGLGCRTKELGLYGIGSGELWEDRRARWIGGAEELSCSF